MISKNKRQITIYYHSDNSIGKQVFAYTTVSKKKLLAIDILKTKVTGTQWAELASRLDKKIIDLINTEHPDFIQKYGENKLDLEQHHWLKIIEKNPHLIKYPIIIDGENYIQIKSTAAIKKYIETDNVA